jgi:bacteriorhodopsin
MGPARFSSRNLSADAGRAYRSSAIYLSLIWMLYPVCWGLADGGNILRPSGEMIFYGGKCLD